MKLVESKNAKGQAIRVLIYYAEISPVGIKLNALALDPERKADHDTLQIDSVNLKDGTVISRDSWGGSGVRNGIFLDQHLTFEFIGIPNLSEVEAITVCGETIKMIL